MAEKNIREKLMTIQTELKAPKGQYNSYGKYHYRSCEDILEALKPHLKANNCTLTVSDEIVQIGDRYYVMAVATLYDNKSEETIQNKAYARESFDKKGMDDSQITGTASSYARKYCLNGLFLIDDTKDADTDEYKNQTEKKDVPVNKRNATDSQIKMMQKICDDNNLEFDIETARKLTLKEASDFIDKFKKGE